MGCNFGLALSGGGFRATLFHLGVVAYLRDAGYLKTVTHISSVSGGSILAAHMAHHWDDYLEEKGFARQVPTLLSFIQRDIRPRITRRFHRWLLRPQKRFDLLQESYSELYGKNNYGCNVRLSSIQDFPKLHILGTVLNTGELCSFSKEGYWTRSQGMQRTDAIETSFAVAASSALPPLFYQGVLTKDKFSLALPLNPSKHHIVDGGVYDNLGIRAFSEIPQLGDEKIHCILVSDAGYPLTWESDNDYKDVVSQVTRPVDIMMSRVANLELDKCKDNSNTSAPSRLASNTIHLSLTPPNPEDILEGRGAASRSIQVELRYIRTDLDAFKPDEIHQLIRHGYCTARETMNGLFPDAESQAGSVGREYYCPDTIRKIKKSDQLAEEIIKEGSKTRLSLFNLADRVSQLHCGILLLIAVLLVFGVYHMWTTGTSAFTFTRAFPYTYKVTIKYDDQLIDNWRETLSLDGLISRRVTPGEPDVGDIVIGSTKNSDINWADVKTAFCKCIDKEINARSMGISSLLHRFSWGWDPKVFYAIRDGAYESFLKEIQSQHLQITEEVKVKDLLSAYLKNKRLLGKEPGTGNLYLDSRNGSREGILYYTYPGGRPIPCYVRDSSSQPPSSPEEDDSQESMHLLFTQKPGFADDSKDVASILTTAAFWVQFDPDGSRPLRFAGVLKIKSHKIADITLEKTDE